MGVSTYLLKGEVFRLKFGDDVKVVELNMSSKIGEVTGKLSNSVRPPGRIV